MNILAIGQSNAEGRYGPAPAIAAPGVRVWDWLNHKHVAAQLGVHPFFPTLDRTGPAGNFPFWFAKRASEHCRKVVHLTHLAASDLRIEYFLPQRVLDLYGWKNEQDHHRFGKSLAPHIFGSDGHAKRALWASGAVTYDVVLIHQGEANVSYPVDTAETLAAKYRALLQELGAAGLTTPETVILMGQINPKYRFFDNHKQALAALSGVRVVPWAGIEDVEAATGVRNNYHATGPGLIALAGNYFAEWLAAETSQVIAQVA